MVTAGPPPPGRRWAIEYEHPAAEAFKLNHPEASTFCANCSVILTRAMHNAGAEGDCDACEEVRLVCPDVPLQQLAATGACAPAAPPLLTCAQLPGRLSCGAPIRPGVI